MEGKYRQKSMYLDFFLILLTSLFLKTFKHVWHIIVFISMLWSLFFMLSLILYWNTNVSLFFPREFSHLSFIFFTTLRILITQTINRFQWRRIQFMSRCFAPKDITRRNILLWDVFAEIKKKISGEGGLDGLNFAPFCLFVSYCSL